MKKVLYIISIILCWKTALASDELPTAKYVDIKRYLGTWYEIVRIENSFQKNCKNTMAIYNARPDGDIEVINSCDSIEKPGERKEAKARAWIVDLNSNAKLKVQFFLTNIKLSIFAGDYWILDIDKNYQYALVGTKNRKYLWVLSRSKLLDKSIVDDLIKKATNLGFDTTKLVK